MFSRILPHELLRNLPQDTLEADEQMLSRLEDAIGNIKSFDKDIPEIVTAIAVYEAFRSSRGMARTEPAWTHDALTNRDLAIKVVGEARHAHDKAVLQATSQSTYEQSLEFFAMQSGAMFCYDFDESDIGKIQKWLNELRDFVQKAEQLSDDHRDRLLKRIEQLQTELHKKLSDLDRFWGLVGDAGVVLHKFGEDTKAVRRIIYAITAIVVKVQSIAHGLPAPAEHPLLPAGDFQGDDGDLRV
jgi:hypothetical protein